MQQQISGNSADKGGANQLMNGGQRKDKDTSGRRRGGGWVCLIPGRKILVSDILKEVYRY
jgi:hypothetical protein